MQEKVLELFTELQRARKLKFIQGVDCLVMNDHPMLTRDTSLFAMSDVSVPHPNTVKMYVRFDPSVSYGQILDIKRYVEIKYGFKCSLCEWSIPSRLDITVNINI
jgi:hypothetical protein